MIDGSDFINMGGALGGQFLDGVARALLVSAGKVSGSKQDDTTQ
ncbi:hypothetical protein [Salmonirosea aquatica]